MEIKIVIGSEIPYKYAQYGQCLRHVKIDLQPVAEKINE